MRASEYTERVEPKERDNQVHKSSDVKIDYYMSSHAHKAINKIINGAAYVRAALSCPSMRLCSQARRHSTTTPIADPISHEFPHRTHIIYHDL